MVRHARLPLVLYHGTSVKNIESICKRGLLRGTVERCGEISRDAKFVDDCVGNVSLATREKDAIFFAVASSNDFYGDQAIIHIDTRKIRKERCVSREMFGHSTSEVKCFDDIPPAAITGIHIRRVKQNGKLRIINEWKNCREL